MVKVRLKTLAMTVPAMYPFYTTASTSGVLGGSAQSIQYFTTQQADSAVQYTIAVCPPGEVSSGQFFSSEEVVSLAESSSLEAFLPDALSTDQARSLLHRLSELGVLDETFQPHGISQSKKGVLAQQIAAKLGIKNQWVTFAHFWHVDANCLRSGYNRGMESKSIGKFLDFIHPAMQDAAR